MNVNLIVNRFTVLIGLILFGVVFFYELFDTYVVEHGQLDSTVAWFALAASLLAASVLLHRRSSKAKSIPGVTCFTLLFGIFLVWTIALLITNPIGSLSVLGLAVMFAAAIVCILMVALDDVPSQAVPSRSDSTISTSNMDKLLEPDPAS